MGNLALKKALASLSHPASIAAVMLLLLNDHLLRQWWPSWWTGKLGDFAWLFFFPLIMAAFWALVLPAALRSRDQWVGGLAFGLTGGVFILAKTLPAFQSGFLQLLGSLLRMPVNVRVDATDLLTVVSLFASAWLWATIDIQPAKKTRFGVPLLTLGLVLTVANMAQPDPGIYCLDRLEDEIIACSSYNCYGSTDGGLTWSLKDDASLIACPSIADENAGTSEKTAVASQAGITYWFTPGEMIERSEGAESGGKVEYEIKPVSQAQKAYYFKIHSGNPILLESPQDGVFDPASGNVIFSMGHEGVLVRQAGGDYQMAVVGPYGRVKTTQPQVLLTILVGELALAACFGGLMVVAIGLYEERSNLKKIVSILAIAIWFFPVFFVPPALSAGTYGSAISSIATLIVGLLVFPLVLDGFILVDILAPDHLLHLAKVAVVGMLLFFVPYLLWGVGLLPGYRTATVIAIILGGGYLILQYRALMLGTSQIRPDVPSKIEPQQVQRSGWLLLAGAVLAVIGIGLTLFGLYYGAAGVIIGLILMLSGVWIRRKVWIAAKVEITEQENPDQGR